MIEATDISIREARFSDLEPLFLFVKQFDLIKDLSIETFCKHWSSFWHDNPSAPENNSDISIGWILEYHNEIVGFFGHFLRRYRLGERDLIASVANTWAVKKEFRKYTSYLSSAYFSQSDVDLKIVTTAILPATRIFSKFSGQPMPQSDYDKVLYWVINSTGFLNAGLKKINAKPAVARVVSYILSPMLNVVKFFKIKSCVPRKIVSKKWKVEKITIAQIGEEFNDLWGRKLTEKMCLYPYRMAKYLAWNLSICAMFSEIVLLCCRSDTQLEGYIALAISKNPDLSLHRGQIIDLFVANDNEEVIAMLFQKAYEIAKEQGCHLLELIGLSEDVRQKFRKYHPFARQYKNFPYYFETSSVELKALLKDAEMWYPMPLDGDSFTTYF